MKKTSIAFLMLSPLLFMSCKGKTGDMGATGATGSTGPTGPIGPGLALFEYSGSITSAPQTVSIPDFTSSAIVQLYESTDGIVWTDWVANSFDLTAKTITFSRPTGAHDRYKILLYK